MLKVYLSNLSHQIIYNIAVGGTLAISTAISRAYSEEAVESCYDQKVFLKLSRVIEV